MPACFTADLWIFYCEELNCWRLTKPGEERHKVITESDKDRLAEVWHLFEKAKRIAPRFVSVTFDKGE